MPLDIPVNNGFWFVNAGTVVPSGAQHRNWKACREYNFISAGQGKHFRDEILKLERDDIICVYESGTGYLGIGKILKKAVKVSEFLYKGKTLHGLPYIKHTDPLCKNGLFTNELDDGDADYCAKVNWYNVNPNPLWIPRENEAYYAPLNTVAIMFRDATIKRLQTYYDVFFNIK